MMFGNLWEILKIGLQIQIEKVFPNDFAQCKCASNK